MIDIKDVGKLHGVWSTYYPSALKGDRDIHIERWLKAFSENTFDEVREAIEKLSNEWADTYEPPFSQLIKYVDAETNKNKEQFKKHKRKISTPEEELSNLYEKYSDTLANNTKLSEDAKNELVSRLGILKEFYNLFHGEGWEYRYFKHFRIENRPFFQEYKGMENGIDLYLNEHNVREDYEFY